MKKKNLLLLPLLALTLTGCGDTSNSKSTSTKVSTAPISNKVDDTTTKGDSATKKTDSTEKDTTNSTGTGDAKKDTTTGDIDSTDSTDSDTTPTTVLSDTYATSKWPTAVKDDMVEYLDGNILPYIDLGSTRLVPSWDSIKSTLTILGGANSVTDATLEAAKKTYGNYGWTAKVADSKMIATNSIGNITVCYFDDDGFASLTATYSEVFNPSAASEWPKDLVADMNTNMANHGDDIPFVYLGTANPTGVFSDGTYTITGMTWDDQIVELAKTAFKDANDSITAANADAPTWTYSDSTNAYGPTFSASITLSDGTDLSVSIDAPYNAENYTALRIPQMIIKYKEPFVVPTEYSWPQKVTDMFADFDNHYIPLFYTGGTPTVYYHPTGSTYATIYGEDNTWNDKILTLAEEACKKDDTDTNAASENKWVCTTDKTVYGIRKTFVKNYTDGCTLKFTVANFGTMANKAEIHVTYSAAFSSPTSGSWSSDVTDMFTNDFEGHAIPWFYIGGTDKLYSHKSGSATAEITTTANTWNNKILTLAQNACENENNEDGVLEANKWVANTESTSTGSKLTETRTFVDGCTLTFTVECYYPNYKNYNYADIKINYSPKFVYPTGDDAKWSDTVQTQITTFLGSNVTLPWIYLGTTKDRVTATIESTTELDIVGTIWNDQLIDKAYEEFNNANDGWNVLKDDYDNQVIAVKTTNEGKKIKAILRKNYNGFPSLEVYCK